VQYSSLPERLPESVGTSKTWSIRREPARNIEQPLPSGFIQSCKVDLNAFWQLDIWLNVREATFIERFTRQISRGATFSYGSCLKVFVVRRG
jgi:hypothetical protein